MSRQIKDSLEKMYQLPAHGKTMCHICNVQEVEAELALLSKELTMSVDILGKIRDSVYELELSLGAQE